MLTNILPVGIKDQHEIRDPIYGFIHLSNSERILVASEPFQRLRHIHQLALTSMVYPGATHKRFEHSLGVMHLAGRVFDTVVANMRPEVSERLPEMRENVDQWRRLVRAAALLHDIGHLPFSHAAEAELLPFGQSHESLTIKLLMESELGAILTEKPFSASLDDIIKLSVGTKDAPDGMIFSEWETILAEIITGSAFGVDRLDYLMRDSYHAGVAYGSVDYLRLTDCLRILPFPEEGEQLDEAKLKLGVTHGGLFSSEALVMARHWMFSQVYFHRVRMLYDEYLCRFLLEWLGEGGYPVNVKGHLSLTDNHVFVALNEAAGNSASRGHQWAKRIVRRQHHVLLESFPVDIGQKGEKELRAKVEMLQQSFGKDDILLLKRFKKASVEDFPVEESSKEIRASSLLSGILSQTPDAYALNLYAERDLSEKIQKKWKKIHGKARRESGD